MSCSYLCLIMYILNMFQDIIIFNDNLTWSDHINDICKNVISVLIWLFECDIYFLKEKTLSDYAVIVLIFIWLLLNKFSVVQCSSPLELFELLNMPCIYIYSRTSYSISWSLKLIVIIVYIQYIWMRTTCSHWLLVTFVKLKLKKDCFSACL